MAYYKKIWEESDFGDNPFRVGDRIKVKGWDEIFIVGTDYAEIERWACGIEPLKTHVVTTTGRVFSISQIEHKL